ncbi:MAG TPA: metallophosphoesterase, partial [Micromonosporaceae bacterium]
MLSVLAFVGAATVVLGLIHLYLWKRLVRDTIRPGRWRRTGGFAALALAVLVPATMVATRAGLNWLA